MNTKGLTKIVSLLLVLCILAGFLSLMPAVTVRAAISASNNFFLKVGANSALANGTRMTNLDEPFYHVDSNGSTKVYIPKTTLTAMAGGEPSSSSVSSVTTATGVIDAVSLDNMNIAYAGWYASISDMNLIAISQTQNFFSGYSDADQVALMKTFLFDAISTSGAKTAVFTSASKPTVAINHPYLFANQTRFNELHAVWQAGENGASDKTLYFYLEEQVNAAEQLYKEYALVSGSSYSGLNLNAGLIGGHQTALNKLPYLNSYQGGGYDSGGRLQASVTHAENIRTLAYAYQVTREARFSNLAYDYAVALGQWEHWGPDHFLNAADAMGPFATAYDWLYNVWSADSGKSIQTIEEILFSHGIAPAYYGATLGNNTPVWQSYNTDGKRTNGYDWTGRTSNWNAVCCAGVTTAALALYNVTRSARSVGIDTAVNGTASNDKTFGDYGTHSLSDTYQAYCQYLIDICIYTLPNIGLGQYVPDGSYNESNRYWDYGTNNIFLMSAALSSATGKDFGILDAWGMDKTVYFALNTMSSDGLSFNYHDSNTTESVSTAWFFYIANEEGLNDRALAAIRRDILENNEDQQKPTFWDAIYYWDDSVSSDLTYPALSYLMKGIDGFTVRDSWNPQVGSMYASFLGGSNYFDHSQIDSGSFVYYNKGTRWFCDLGTENYNAPGFWYYPFEESIPADAPKNRGGYYAMNPEGNNCLVLTDVSNHTSTLKPSIASDASFKDLSLDYENFFGQYIHKTKNAGGGKITSYVSNSHGAYAILDNKDAYQIDGTYTLVTKDDCGKSSETRNQKATFRLASSVLRGMLSTNDNRTVVIQDEASFVEAQEFGWVAHILPTTEVMLSVDGTTAFLNDGKTTIRVKLLDPNGLGLKLEIKNQDDRLLDSTIAATPNVTGPNAPKDFTAYKKLVVQGVAQELKMAIVIEEMIPGVTMNDAEGIGYSFTPMSQWNQSIITPDDRHGAGDNGGSYEPTGPVATVTVRGSGSAESHEALSFFELAELINGAPSGATVTVSLNRSNKEPITLTHACTVQKNGNELLATSATLMAMVNGDTVSYESGRSVTVTFNINGTEYTRQYSSSMVATYDGATPTSLVYEEEGGIRTYYTWGGWSRISGGKAMDYTSLIVTSENNYFYVAKTPYDGAFVTVKGNSIVGHASGADFFTSAIRSPSTAFDRIDITNDFYYYATGNNHSDRVDRTMNVYLNGHTITYTAKGEYMHMFYPSTSGVELNIYGPGGLNNEAKSSNLISGSPNGGAKVLIEGVTIYSASSLIDHRYGNATFRNCDITVEGTCNAFVSTNRNNVVASNPYVLIDGCTVSMPTNNGSAVFAVYSGATIEVTGGTVISTATGVPLFLLANESMGQDASYNFVTGYSRMKAIIGEVYHECPSIFTSYAYCNYSGNTTDNNGNGTPDKDEIDLFKPTSAQIYYGNGYKSVTDPSELNRESGIKVVNSGDSDYPYVLSDSYATVNWKDKNGVTKYTDYWASGTIPSPSAAVISALGVGSNQMLGYTLSEVSGGETYNVLTSNMTKIAIKVNMSLEADLKLNFFVQNISGIQGFAIDGGDMIAPSELETVTLSDGNTYYKVVRSGIGPEFAGAETTLTIYHTTGTLTRSVSPARYVDKALEDAEVFADVASRQLLVNILKYSEAAYVYSGRSATHSKEYTRVRQIYEKYKQYATASLVNKQPAELGAVSHAIHGTCLNIGEMPSMRFNFVGTGSVDASGNPMTAFSGTVVFTYTSDGATVTKTVVVQNGIVASIDGSSIGNGIALGYFDVERKAFDMVNSAISFSVNGGDTYSYSLANYYYHSATENDSLTRLLNALYAYCETARIYRTAHPTNEYYQD